jgi:Fe-S-cluster containining protein
MFGWVLPSKPIHCSSTDKNRKWRNRGVISNNISSELKRKLAALERIYDVYEAFIHPFHLACRPLCAACCTCNVTLTTLEGYHLIGRLRPDQRRTVFDSVRKAAANKRYQPLLTINQIAAMCRDGKAIPEEANDPLWGRCPLLKADSCPVYELRPFGCRCMVSRSDCRKSGQADIDELVLSVNHLILQYIEHLDTGGTTGNLIDVLLFFASKQNREAYLKGGKTAGRPALVPNHAIPVLMIPPEHRQHVLPILKKIGSIDLDKTRS